MKSRSILSWITSHFSKENKKKSRISVSRRRSAPFNGTRGVKSVTNWYVGLSTDNRCFPFPPNIVITRLVCMCTQERNRREMIAPAKAAAAAAGPVKQNIKNKRNSFEVVPSSISWLLGCWPSVLYRSGAVSRARNAEGFNGVDPFVGRRRRVPMRSRFVRYRRSDAQETLPQSRKSRKVPREMGRHQFQSGNGNYAKQ